MLVKLKTFSEISIHALREEGDPFQLRLLDLLGNFNPRPPRGGRLPRSPPPRLGGEFQSTPSARRATLYLRKPLEGY